MADQTQSDMPRSYTAACHIHITANSMVPEWSSHFPPEGNHPPDPEYFQNTGSSSLRSAARDFWTPLFSQRDPVPSQTE